MAYKDDANSPFIITVGAVGGFLVIVIVIGLQAWFMSEEQAELDHKYAGVVNQELQDVRQQQRTNLTTYRWIDRNKGIAAIPIDRAMKLLVEQKDPIPVP